MLRRYPHTGKIISIVESDAAIPVITPTQVDVVGRYEPAAQASSLNYSAKFYCKLNAFEPFEVDGHKFIYESKQFKIVQLHNYQTHCEIWLE